ncbi:hypothetical protein M0R89_04780 [Halorussus limi]|uniref:Uncharacterized protein n=1 Tax=Halorussus limi TaxID=2938695 RepID=A0A8U0HX87_9EURY|nr:hypothetical protein [Halorussus limi]UPV75383.1 hypothetical protein M0R89_04780 [Halorussus limi]
MCHRRGERSRTSSRASESAGETEREDPPGLAARAKRRLVALVSADSEAESPDSPAVEREPETPSVDATSEEPTASEELTESEDEADASDEREREPIPAHD